MFNKKHLSSTKDCFVLPIAFFEGIGGTYKPGKRSDSDSLSTAKSLYRLKISNLSLFKIPYTVYITKSLFLAIYGLATEKCAALDWPANPRSILNSP